MKKSKRLSALMLWRLRIQQSIKPITNKADTVVKVAKTAKKDKDLFQIIEKILITGSQRIHKDMVDGLISMINSVGSSNNQTTDYEITWIKFFRLVMFNWTFYLNKHEPGLK